jgi:hypothetical protein
LQKCAAFRKKSLSALQATYRPALAVGTQKKCRLRSYG